MACYKDRYGSSSPCYPCLPRCHRSEIEYCSDDRDYPKGCCYREEPLLRSPSRQRHSRGSPPPRARYCSPRRCSSPPRVRYCSPPRCCSPPECCSPPPDCCVPAPRCCYSPPSECCDPPPDCRSCYKTCCRPVRTKYVIPCYRYEDGRIENQPTVLMQRACEVAVGVRRRRKPFVHSSYCADDDLEGNCCFHFEAKNKGCCPGCCSTCSGCAGCTDCSVCSKECADSCVPPTVTKPSDCCVYY